MIDGYVIKNVDTGKYVTPPNSKKSYTSSLQNARIFKNYDVAKAHCCGNEIVSNIENELNWIGYYDD